MKRTTKITSMLFLLLMTAWTQMFSQELFVKEKALKPGDLQAGMDIVFKAISSDNQLWVNWGEISTSSPQIKGIYTLEGSEGDWLLKRKYDNKYIKKNNASIEFGTQEEATHFNIFTPEINDQSNDPNGISGISKVSLPEWGEGYQIRLSDAENNFLNVQGQSSKPNFGTGNGSWSVVMLFNAADFLPFNLSEAPSNDKFAENTNWYYLKINTAQGLNRYAAYTETEDNGNQINLSADNPISYGSFWAFVKTSDGKIQIYNAGAGASKVLTLTDTPETANDKGEIRKLTMADASSSTNNVWDCTQISTTGNQLFKMSVGDKTFYINHTDANIGKNVLYGKLSATGPWSDLQFEAVDINNAINTTKARQEATQARPGVIGALTDKSYTQCTAELDKGTMEGLIEALRIIHITGETVPFDPSKYYRIENVMRRYGDNNNHAYEGGYLEITDHLERPDYKSDYNFYSNVRSASRASAIWKFEATAEGGQYNLFNLNAKKYVKGADGSYLTEGATEAADADIISITPVGHAQFNIKKQGSAQRLHISGMNDFSGAAMYYNQGETDSPSAWYLIPATSIDVNITDAGYATVNYPFAVQVPKEVTAYTGKADAENGVFTLSEIEGGIIPANTPVVLQAAAGTHTLTILADNNDPALESGLEGTLLSETIEGTTNAYILGKKENSEAGFYQMSEDDRTLAANKAYLVLSPEASAVRSIIFSDGTTTGIESTVAEGAEAEEYYDLKGRRIMNPTKGIYVTKSGKKVLFNK